MRHYVCVMWRHFVFLFAVSTPPRPRPAPKENIEEFVPDGEVDEFLGEEDEEDEDFEDDR